MSRARMRLRLPRLISRTESGQSQWPARQSPGENPGAAFRPATDRRSLVYNRIRHDAVERIDRLAVHPHLVVEVGTGGEAGGTDEGDLLAALHALTAHHEDLRAVRIPRHQTIAMIDGDEVPVAILPLHFRHRARGRCLDLGAHRRGDIDTLMRAGQVEDG